MSDDMSVAAVVAAYTKLVRQLREKGIEPVAWEVRAEEPVEYRPKDSNLYKVLLAVEETTEDHTAYDRGDLCSEIDRALGDLLERTMHRYMSKKIAHNVRRAMVSGLADKVIDYDKSGSDPAKAQSV